MSYIFSPMLWEKTMIKAVSEGKSSFQVTVTAAVAEAASDSIEEKPDDCILVFSLHAPFHTVKDRWSENGRSDS